MSKMFDDHGVGHTEQPKLPGYDTIRGGCARTAL